MVSYVESSSYNWFLLSLCSFRFQKFRGFNSEHTQEGGRKKKTAKRLGATNLIGLLLAYFVVVFFTYTITLIWSLTKGEGEVWRKICSNITNITDVKLGLPSV